MSRLNIKSALLSDIKQLRYDFVRVYPRSFKWITSYWYFSLAFLFILFSAFYLDSSVRLLFLGISNNLLDSLFNVGRWYGNGMPTLYIFLFFYIVGLAFKNFKFRNIGVLVFETYIYTGLITLIFKSVFGRWRPFTARGDFSFYGFTWGPNEQLSFTSGHASVAFALSCVLAGAANNIYLKIFCYLLAVITALSRIYHDQHWLSDIIMGSFIGILISTLLILMHKEKKEANIPHL